MCRDGNRALFFLRADGLTVINEYTGYRVAQLPIERNTGGGVDSPTQQYDHVHYLNLTVTPPMPGRCDDKRAEPPGHHATAPPDDRGASTRSCSAVIAESKAIVRPGREGSCVVVCTESSAYGNQPICVGIDQHMIVTLLTPEPVEGSIQHLEFPKGFYLRVPCRPRLGLEDVRDDPEALMQL